MDFDLTREQQEFRRIVHDFVAREVRPQARHVDETGEFNWPAVRKMGPLGLLGLQVPEEYGGAAWTASAPPSPSRSWAGAAARRRWPSPPTTTWAKARWWTLARSAH
jgi:alkylation response protein AidB-like acyl-CoA dehydrogenase